MDPIKAHKELKGKIKVVSKAPLDSKDSLSTYYTPGVAEVCKKIVEKPESVYDLTIKSNSVAIVSDGTRVLGLGNIGPEAALPVMEGKAMLLSYFANIDAFPICLNTKKEEEIIKTVKAIAPSFGLINLEDIETPKVFRIYDRLNEELNIPVFHDDQHGTAMVVLAGLINATKILNLDLDTPILIIGCGSAGYAIANILHTYGFTSIACRDSRGLIYKERENLSYQKQKASEFLTYSDNYKPQIIISASKPGAVSDELLKQMIKPSILFSLSNPVPEVSKEKADMFGIDIYGSGRSDLPNQINNAVAFPGFIKAVLDLKIRKISYNLFVKAAVAIANTVENPTKEKIIPTPFNKNLIKNIKQALSD